MIPPTKTTGCCSFAVTRSWRRLTNLCVRGRGKSTNREKEKACRNTQDLREDCFCLRSSWLALRGLAAVQSLREAATSARTSNSDVRTTAPSNQIPQIVWRIAGEHARPATNTAKNQKKTHHSWPINQNVHSVLGRTLQRRGNDSNDQRSS